jgi:ammonium transporter, Amt family
LLVGLFADPQMIVYLGLGKTSSVAGAGLFYGHPRQLLIQAGAALTIIIWDGAVTFVILRVIKFFTPLRYPDAILEAGDVAAHGEVAYPMEEPDAPTEFAEVPGEPVPAEHHRHAAGDGTAAEKEKV